MNTKNWPFNFAVVDMAAMGKLEKRLFQLHFNHGVPPDALCDVFVLEPGKVGRLLRRGLRKYRSCSRWLGVP